jgi:hypothetical protein
VLGQVWLLKEGGDKRAFTQYGVSPEEAKTISIYYIF